MFLPSEVNSVVLCLVLEVRVEFVEMLLKDCKFGSIRKASPRGDVKLVESLGLFRCSLFY